jgi:hypothetical protein
MAETDESVKHMPSGKDVQPVREVPLKSGPNSTQPSRRSSRTDARSRSGSHSGIGFTELFDLPSDLDGTGTGTGTRTGTGTGTGTGIVTGTGTRTGTGTGTGTRTGTGTGTGTGTEDATKTKLLMDPVMAPQVTGQFLHYVQCPVGKDLDNAYFCFYRYIAGDVQFAYIPTLRSPIGGRYASPTTPEVGRELLIIKIDKIKCRKEFHRSVLVDGKRIIFIRHDYPEQWLFQILKKAKTPKKDKEYLNTIATNCDWNFQAYTEPVEMMFWQPGHLPTNFESTCVVTDNVLTPVDAKIKTTENVVDKNKKQTYPDFDNHKKWGNWRTLRNYALLRGVGALIAAAGVGVAAFVAYRSHLKKQLAATYKEPIGASLEDMQRIKNDKSLSQAQKVEMLTTIYARLNALVGLTKSRGLPQGPLYLETPDVKELTDDVEVVASDE